MRWVDDSKATNVGAALAAVPGVTDVGARGALVALETAQQEARNIMRARRHQRPGQADLFGITTSETWLQLYRTLTGGIFVVSIGVAAVSAQSESVEALMVAADTACFMAKDKGRNQVQIFVRLVDRHLRRLNVDQMSVAARIVAPRPNITAGRTEFVYTRPMTGLPQGDSPLLLDTSYTITADIEVPQGGAEGMILTSGGRFGGYGFYLLKGKPVFTWNLVDLKRVELAAYNELPHLLVPVIPEPGQAKAALRWAVSP